MPVLCAASDIIRAVGLEIRECGWQRRALRLAVRCVDDYLGSGMSRSATGNA